MWGVSIPPKIGLDTPMVLRDEGGVGERGGEGGEGEEGEEKESG